MKPEKLKRGDKVSDTPYCVCNIIRQDDGFMIGCDGPCENWFHNDCISLKKRHADRIEKFFCDSCREKDPSLEIQYKPGFGPPESKRPEIKQETFIESKKQDKPVAEKKPDKSLVEKKQPKAIVSKPKPPPEPPVRVGSAKRKPAPGTPRYKSKVPNRRQCGNPDCQYEARPESKYCSDDCGVAFNKLRYEKFYIPKYKALEKNHSQARLERMNELERLEKEKADLLQTIKNLKQEREQLDMNVATIKRQAEAMRKEQNVSRDNDDEDSSDDESPDKTTADDNPISTQARGNNEEALSSDAAKMFCVTCGHQKDANKILSHWFTCHKKIETQFAFTTDIPAGFKGFSTDDPDPKLYCNQQDKKFKRYCMNVLVACPQHTNWLADKNEVCGCPLEMSQELKLDGKYCLELKKDCHIHYHWDKFRQAQIDTNRIQAFTRLDGIHEKQRVVAAILDDTYGGVVGVMLHNTVDHLAKRDDEQNGDDEFLDVQQ